MSITENKNIFDVKKIKPFVNYLIDFGPLGIMKDGQIKHINNNRNLYYMSDKDDRLYYYDSRDDDIWDITAHPFAPKHLTSKCEPMEWISLIYFKNGWGEWIRIIDHLEDLERGNCNGLK
jgi:hypothetical protein